MLLSEAIPIYVLTLTMTNEARGEPRVSISERSTKNDSGPPSEAPVMKSGS